jgi:hypothetical protein
MTMMDVSTIAHMHIYKYIKRRYNRDAKNVVE